MIQLIWRSPESCEPLTYTADMVGWLINRYHTIVGLLSTPAPSREAASLVASCFTCEQGSFVEGPVGHQAWCIICFRSNCLPQLVLARSDLNQALAVTPAAMAVDPTCPKVKNMLLLDSEGKRIAVKYYSPEW